MKWEGEAFFGPNLILFRGRSVVNVLHAMPVNVLALSHDASSVIMNADGRQVGGRACLVKPLSQHRVVPDRPVTLAFLKPAKWAFPDDCAPGSEIGFQSLDPNVLPDPLEPDLSVICVEVERLFLPDVAAIDPRLSAALKLLEGEPGTVSVAQAAQTVGLSVSRLRALAQRELGAPLSRWLTWTKLEQAARNVVTGEGLAQSAAAGGFVDQAHFSNAMRRILGTAPSEITPVRNVN